MGFYCCYCESVLPNIGFLLHHLRRVHSIQINGQDVRCGQSDCPRIFTCFKALKRHLCKEHSMQNMISLMPQLQPRQLSQYSVQVDDDDDDDKVDDGCLLCDSKEDLSLMLFVIC